MGSERWISAIENLSEMSSTLHTLQNFITDKAVFVEPNTFTNASLCSQQARTIKALEKRVESLERELDAAITCSAHARSAKHEAEGAQKAAETRVEEVTEELENTTKVFELHMEELRRKEEEIKKRDNDIQVLKAIVHTLSGTKPSHSARHV